MKIAVIGSGIAGLGSAWRLARAGHAVALFEAGTHFGGHTHTIDVTLDGIRWGVDTGFLVFNHRTYPLLTRLFDDLRIATTAAEMSFSVTTRTGLDRLEWSGSNLRGVFAQPSNLLRPGFLRMLRDILRFNRAATGLARSAASADSAMSLGAYLERHRYSVEFRDWYLLPMAGCIWSCPATQMLQFPLASFIRFCDNHGLLQLAGRPQWRTVTGGARRYVERMLLDIERRHIGSPVEAVTRSGAGVQLWLSGSRAGERFDHVVIATHSDQALRLLHDSSPDEHDVLGSIRYQANRAVLHTDTGCLPQRRAAWAAWNYQSSGGREAEVCVHYLLNRLQPLPFSTPLLVSLNPIEMPDAAKVLGEFDYAHPVFDAAAIAAQQKIPVIQGRNNTWFAGAWTGYGFHEDGLRSGLAVAEAILQQAAADGMLPAAA